VEEWRSLLAHATRRTPVAGGVRLEFPQDFPTAEITRLAAAEHDCCNFFAFTVLEQNSATVLEVRAPDEAQQLLNDLFGAA